MPTVPNIEEAVLGALLLDADALLLLPKALLPEAFSSQSYQHIYRAIQQLYATGCRVDLLSITAYLQDHGQLDAVGGPYELVGLTSRVASSANITHHAQLVLQAYLRRRLLAVARRTLDDTYIEELDTFDLLERLTTELMEISGHGVVPAVPSLVHLAMEELERRASGTEFSGISTGFVGIDEFTSGWQPSDFILLGARPGMGKTALALQLAHAAATAGHTVLFFSLEMSALQLTKRVLLQRAEVDAQKKPLHPAELARLRAMAPIIARLPLHIDDTPNISLQRLRARCYRQQQLPEGLDLVVIDYLQLITTVAPYHQREQQIGAISRGLKQLARELNVPVIALSQLSRASDQRADPRPQLSDLRESGTLEQDADIVSLLWRRAYYGIEQDEDGLPTAGRAELIFAKHRNGALGALRLGWRGRYTRFDDLGPVASAAYSDAEADDTL